MKTKAISKYNVAVTVQSGKVGNVRYYQKGGQTYVRSANNQVKNNPRTDAQMQQRLKFASLASLYKEFASIYLLRKAFSSKAPNQSDYNAFMQMNQGQGVFFTKEQMQRGACIALPVTVSSGRLPQIFAHRDGSNNLVSTIETGDLVLGADTTVEQVSKAIIANNRMFKNKDVITVIVVEQNINNATTPAIPWVLVDFDKFILDTSSSNLFSEAYPDFTIATNKLAYLDFDSEGCYGFVHTSGNKISNCVLTDANQTVRASYESDEAFENARDSYGSSVEAILYNSDSGMGLSSGSNDDDNTPDVPGVVAAPTISGASPLSLQTTVTIAAANGIAIHHTTDGTVPTSESQLYA